MIRKHFRFKRFALGLALGFVVAAFAAPLALAKPVSGNTLSGYDPWAYGVIQRSTQPVDVGPLDPWAYNVVHKSSATPAPTAGSSSQAFDYGDAGIGAGVSFGIVLILVGTVVFGFRYRRIQRSGLATS